MKTLLKILAVAAALGLVPAAAMAQSAEGSAPPAVTGNAQEAAPAAPATAAPTPAAATPTAAAPAAADAAAAAPTYTTPQAARDNIGAPDGRMGIQEQVTPIGREARSFHDWILMPVITIITLLVLALMIYVILRYRRAAHPNPSRTTHNTTIEVVWTLLPVLILVVIAVPSIRLLANQYSPPNADLTVKAIGNQWYWNYEYPDHGIQLTSNMMPEAADAQAGQRGRTDEDGPRLLAVDERLVVPVGATVKVIVTSNDVIHAFGVPAFWVKIDAVPGRLNETWFRAEQPGIYYGQCYELCGARHAYMPIAVEVVSQEDFERWVASKGGTLPGAAPAEANAAAPAVTAEANSGTPASPAPTNSVNAVGAAPATSNQAATAN